MRPRRPSLLSTLIVAGAAAAGVASDTRGDDHARPCPRGTEAENKSLSVFNEGASLVICFKRSSNHWKAGDTDEFTSSYAPGTARLRGTVVAAAEIFCDTDQPCNEYVRAANAVAVPVRGFLRDAGPVFSKVGSVRVSGDLRAGWISCHTSRRMPAKFDGRRKPGCVKPGPHNTVWAVRPYIHPVKLDAHKGIDPLSLRLRDRRLKWRRNDRWHSYNIDRLPEGTPTPRPTAPPP